MRFGEPELSFELDLNVFFVKVVARGVVAQLGEHLTGSQEVTGSSPVNSTIFFSHGTGFRLSV